MGDVWQEAREMPICEVLAQLGAERDKHDKQKWRINEKSFSVTKDNQAWLNVNGSGNKGKGSIDLVAEIFEISPTEALNIILGYKYQRIKISAKNTAISISEPVKRNHEKELPVQSQSFVPKSNSTTWPVVRHWLSITRCLDGKLIDELHHDGLVFSDSNRNAIFLKSVGGTVGCEVRGTRGIDFRRNWGGDGLFQIPATDNNAPVVIVEGALDAIALRELGHAGKIVSTGGGCPQKAIDYLKNLNTQVLSGFDVDESGEQFFQNLKEQLPFVKKITPPLGLKDWNDVVVSQKTGDCPEFCLKTVNDEDNIPFTDAELKKAGALHIPANPARFCG